jgi:folate-binding protein YgfZ
MSLPDDELGEYRAAVEAVGCLVRESRRWLRVAGRAPRQMLQGMVSGRMPLPATPDGPGRWRGRAEPSALLDVKGRMLSELRVLPVAGDPESLLIDLPAAGFDEALAHFRKYLPPRFASLEDVGAATVLQTVLGPGAAELASRVLESLGGSEGSRGELEGLDEGDLLAGEAPRRLTAIRTMEVATPAWDLLSGGEDAEVLRSALLEGGARPVGEETWRTLRLEAGRPEYGADMDASTIPVEAGIQGRVVDYTKGCFTGQEVLIRIRDRGRVNRHLRGLRMGARTDVPPPGTELFRPDGKAMGVVTSSARSPRFGEVIGLGMVRREVEPPAELRVGGADGPAVGVRDLDDDWRP